MLTAAERRRGIIFGLLSLTGICAFIGTAFVALLTWDAWAAPNRLFTSYTLRILQFTLLQAALSTLLSICLAMPVALALARRPKFPGRIWILRLMALPMGLPVLIGALGLIGIWGRQGLLNGLLMKLGLEQPISIYGLSGILLAHVFFNMPLAVRLILAALERVPAEQWRLAASLGMPATSVFRFIEWPAARRVVPGIAGLVFMLCATSFTLVLVLGGGPAATTLEVAIYQSLRFDFDPPRAIALSLLQIAMTAVILVAMHRFTNVEDYDVTSGRRPRRFDGRTPAARLYDAFVVMTAVTFLVLPLGAVASAGLQADLWRLATSRVFLNAAWTSLAIAFLAGILAVTVSLGVIHARHAIADMKHSRLPTQAISTSLAMVSMTVLLVPPVVLGTGWFLALRSFGDVARFAPILVAVINMLMALPFAMRILSPAVITHHRRTDRLCANLGLSGLTRLRRVDIPVLAGPMLTALSFSMALSLGDLGAVALFGSNDLTTLPWLVYSRLSSYRTNDADGLALLLGFICLMLATLGAAGGWRRRHD